MKKLLISLAVVFIFSGNVFAFVQQGFSDFVENKSGINFTCETQCLVQVGKLENKNYLKLNGEFSGNGLVAYGFLIGEQFVQGQSVQVSSKTKLEKEFSFSSLPFFSQLPPQAEVFFVVNGKISGKNLELDFGSFSLGEKIKLAAKEFFTFDTFKPYTVNLLYGPKISGQNANGVFYWIFFLGLAGLLILKFSEKISRKEFGAYSLSLALCLWVIYDLRMGAEVTSYFVKDYQTYTSKEFPEKVYRDRGDFYSFIDFADKNIKKNEELAFFAGQSWPYNGSTVYFLYPRTVKTKLENQKIALFYNYPNYSLNGSGLSLDGKLFGTGEVLEFRPGAFIFKKD